MRLQDTVAAHQAIYRAIESHDAGAAAGAMTEHLAVSKRGRRAEAFRRPKPAPLMYNDRSASS
jgi:DNA-binding GntR family transcriptional regulator